MNRRILYLLTFFIIIEQVVNIQIERKDSSLSFLLFSFILNNLLEKSDLYRFRREVLWKTTAVLNCIRRLRSIIIRPSKLDISTEMLNCLQQVKTPKSNKKKIKS
jgi:hypothetical protein